jgi:general secretion pathway protein G
LNDVKTLSVEKIYLLLYERWEGVESMNLKKFPRTGRKGFTLVELLIVIIIIGILAGAMMMLLGSSSDRADATKIISDLRSLKSASLQFYASNPNVQTLTIDDLRPFMDANINPAHYQAVGGPMPPDGAIKWYIYYQGPNMIKPGVRKALVDSATDSNLLGQEAMSNASDTPPYGVGADPDMVVGMKAR